ncbi:MAG: FAD-binding protein [Planctomycetaceae bacterium]
MSSFAGANENHRLIRRLGEIIRRGRVLSAPAQLAGYDADGLGYKTFRPDAVVIPADADELSELMSHATALDVPVTIRGAGTSLSGGPVAAQGGVVVHTSSLKQIRHIEPKGFWCEVECSVTLNQLDAAVQPFGLFYPPDPSSGAVCTIGGNVAMNAGGAHCFRYGVTSNYVLGVEAIMLDGTVHQFGGPAGGRGKWCHDWKRLMIGSEGTLAAFTRFWLRLLPRPEKCWTYRATFRDLNAVEKVIHRLAHHASFPVAIEMMDPRCVAMVENSPMAVGLPRDAFLIVAEIDGPTDLVDSRAEEVRELFVTCGAMAVEYSDDEVARQGLWKARKVAGGLMGQMSPDFLVQDAVIPKAALASALKLVYDEADAAGLPVVNVFHAGDGNLHPNFLFDSRRPGELEKVEAISKRLMHFVVQAGGTLSGEHGIGNDKSAYMPLVFHGDSLRLQLAVPRVFNAAHQLNPGKVFQTRQFQGVSTLNSVQATPEAARAKLEQSEERLFTTYFDETDGIICVSASVTGSELSELCKPAGFRFPLLLSDDCSLFDQFRASGYAPASSRFGAICDNITGVNWKLPSGRRVRIGERVVKSTTGFDLLRFLLHADKVFGEPTGFVLRLRPVSDTNCRFDLTGDTSNVNSAAEYLINTCWIHWLDAVSIIVEDPESGTLSIRIDLNCPSVEWDVYATFLQGFAQQFHLNYEFAMGYCRRRSALPDIVLKTTPDQVMNLALQIGESECECLCEAIVTHGVLHVYFNEGSDPDKSAADRILSIRNRVTDLAVRFERQLTDVGGDWQSRHIERHVVNEHELDWHRILFEEFASE